MPDRRITGGEDPLRQPEARPGGRVDLLDDLGLRGDWRRLEIGLPPADRRGARRPPARRGHREGATSRGRRPPGRGPGPRARERGGPSRRLAGPRHPASRPSGARRWGRPRTMSAAATARTARPRPALAPGRVARPRAARGATPRARRATSSAARPGRRHSRRRRSRASGRRPSDGRCASTSRAASPIAVVVTRRCASGSHAWESAPCWLTTTSGPKVAASSGQDRPERVQPRRPRRCPDSIGTLTDVPAATPSPSSSDEARPREQVRPDSWIDTVSDARVGPWIAWTPSPWWTSRSR